MFNEDIKERYLGEIENEKTRLVKRYIFRKSAGAEDQLNKDLYHFTLDEIKNVINEANPPTVTSARSLVSHISKYIEWASDNGYTDTVLNPVQHEATPEWYDSLVVKGRKLLISESELNEVIESLDNAQDQALIRCLFEGMWGDGIYELRTLKINNVNSNTNEVNLTNEDKEQRILTISDKCLKYIQNANAQDIYLPFSNSERGSGKRSLVESEFVFRGAEGRRTDSALINVNTLYGRLRKIREEYELEYIAPIRIRESGVLYEAYKIIQEEGRLDNSGYEKIGEKFKYNKSLINGQLTYNKHLLQKVINADNLKRYYGIDADGKL